jgi:hypothetical protein
MVGVKEIVQAAVGAPQEAGATLTPGFPAAASEAGMSDGFELCTENRRLPIPLTVNAAGGELGEQVQNAE